MGWQLFTWILSAGLFSMLWFLYLSIKQDEKRWKPVAQTIRRHERHRLQDSAIANAGRLGGQCKDSFVMRCT
jgi:hypothetical protein